MNQQGFSLIELLIVIGILGILAAIVYPNYIDHVETTRRQDAVTDLLRWSSQLEREFTVTNSYTTASTNIAFPASGAVSSDGLYNLTLTTTPATYTLTATALGSQINDTVCRRLTINQAGTTTSQDDMNNLTSAECWPN